MKVGVRVRVRVRGVPCSDLGDVINDMSENSNSGSPVVSKAFRDDEPFGTAAQDLAR